MLQRKIIIFPNPHVLAQEGAQLFSALCSEAIAQKDYFVVGLSGGTTPREMHRLLGAEPYPTKIPWAQVHFFWVDERIVPYDSDASNYGTAKSDFLDLIPVPPENVHPVVVDRAPGQCAIIYEAEILEFFGPGQPDLPSFDLLLLGLGEDGHTASLFRGQEARWQVESLVASVKGGTPDVYRVTMTPRLINASHAIAFLVCGSRKKTALKDVLTNPNSRLPAAQISPQQGRLFWLLDTEASTMLANSSVIPILEVVKDKEDLSGGLLE